MRSWRRILGLALCAIAHGACAQSGRANEGQRPLAVEDLFSQYQLPASQFSGATAQFSADGRRAVLQIVRPWKEAKRFVSSLYFGPDRTDLFLVAVDQPDAVNLTNGRRAASGHWAPRWAADGERIAFLSTRDGDVGIWTWSSPARRFSRLTDRSTGLPVDLNAYPFDWISERHLLAWVMPEGHRSMTWLGYENAGVVAEKQRASWAGGRGVQIYTAPPPPLSRHETRGALLLVDAVSNDARALAHGEIGAVQLSPNRAAIAFVRRVSGWMPSADAPIPLATGSLSSFELDVVSMRGESMVAPPARAALQGVVPSSIRWLPDGTGLLFAALRNGAIKLQKLRLADSAVLEVGGLEQLDFAPPAQQPLRLEVTRDGLFVRGTLREQSRDAEKSATAPRFDWWRVAADSSLSCVTCALEHAPVDLQRVCNGGFVFTADDKLWQVSTNGTLTEISLNTPLKLRSIEWPMEDRVNEHVLRSAAALPEAIVLRAVAAQGKAELLIVDLQSHRSLPIFPPDEAAILLDFAPKTRAAIWATNTRTGLRIWLSANPTQSARVVYSANAFLSEIQSGSWRRVDYMSGDGEPLIGWLMLPPNYRDGDRTPLIVVPYLRTLRAQPPVGQEIFSPTTPMLNMQLAAARGYAVLFPSIRWNRLEEPDDPLLRVTSGVLPAVNRAVEAGIADPVQVYLFGHSYGGFCTYALITQTSRFRAAVASGWAVNLISSYGQFYHYVPIGAQTDPAEQVFPGGLYVESSFRLHAPPWADLGRYLRNSPIFYVDRVATPLLMLHGELDGNSAQPEEFFTSLLRQGKRAEYRRYWGEQHVLVSPANIADQWQSIFRWFDEFSDTRP